MTTKLENLIDACQFLNTKFKAQLNRHDIKTVKTIGATETEMLLEFDAALQALDRMAEIVIPGNLVDFYNDVAIGMLDKLEEGGPNEETQESDAEPEKNDSEEAEESEAEELDEETTGDEERETAGDKKSETKEIDEVELGETIDEPETPIEKPVDKSGNGGITEDSKKNKPKTDGSGIPDDSEDKKEPTKRRPPVRGPRRVVMPNKKLPISIDDIDKSGKRRVTPDYNAEAVYKKRTTPTGDFERKAGRRRSVPPARTNTHGEDKKKAALAAAAAEEPKNETTEKPKNSDVNVGTRRERKTGRKNLTPKSRSDRKSRVVADKPRPTEEAAGIYTLLNRKAVLAELKRISPKKPKKDSSSVELVAIRNGDMISYNQKKALLYKMPDDSMSMDFGLNAYAFKQALESIKTNEITLTENKNNIMVTGGKISIALHKFKDDYVTSLYESLGVRRAMEQFKPIPTGFLTGLAYCTEVATRDTDNLRMLHTIKISDEMMYANAGYQSIRYRITPNLFDTFFLLKESADQILKFQPQTYFVNRQWAHFQDTNDTVLSIRLYMPQQGEIFVDTDKMFSPIEDGFSFGSGIDATNLKDLAKFASKDGMQVKIKEDGTAIFTANGNYGKMTVSSTVVNFKSDQPIQFNIDPLILIMCMGSGRVRVNTRNLQMSTDEMDYIIALYVED